MASILKQETSMAQAKNFISSFGTNNHYMFHGRPQPWVDDAVPPMPVDTMAEDREIYTSMVGGNKIQITNVRHCRQRLDWQTGKIYDMYRDDYDGTTAGVTVDGSIYFPKNLAETNFIVMVDAGLGNFHVYKCLDNRLQTTSGSVFAGTAIPSTVKPTGTTNEVIQLSDGYRWKYMYTISELEKAQFLAPTFMPIQNVANNVATGGAGAVHAIMVDNGGSGYTTTPTITFQGDGTVAPTVDSITITNGTIRHIKLASFGTGYSYCKVVISAPSSGGVSAVVHAVITPHNGHGAHNIDECYADKIMISRSLDNTLVPGGYRYRQVGILRNPTNFATEVLTSADEIQNDTRFQYVIVDGAGNLVNGDVVKNVAGDVVGVVSRFTSVAEFGVQVISVSAGGTGYTQAPLVVLAAPTGDNPVTATAEATVQAGVVTRITITNPGSGYLSAPAITITPVVGGDGAAAFATIANNSFVSLIQRPEDRIDSIDNNDVLSNFDATLKLKVFGKQTPTIKYGSGKIIFVENRTPVIRTNITQERYKFILDF